jgi:hypothetical protein
MLMNTGLAAVMRLKTAASRAADRKSDWADCRQSGVFEQHIDGVDAEVANAAPSRNALRRGSPSTPRLRQLRSGCCVKKRVEVVLAVFSSSV